MQFKKIAMVFLVSMIAGFAGIANAACDNSHLADCSSKQLLGMINDTLLSVRGGSPVPAKSILAGTKDVVLSNLVLSAWFGEGVEVEEIAFGRSTINYYGVDRSMSDKDITNLKVLQDGIVRGVGSFINGRAVIKFPEKIFIQRGGSKSFQIVGDLADSSKGKMVAISFSPDFIKGIGEKSRFHIIGPSHSLWLGMENMITVR